MIRPLVETRERVDRYFGVFSYVFLYLYNIPAESYTDPHYAFESVLYTVDWQLLEK